MSDFSDIFLGGNNENLIHHAGCGFHNGIQSIQEFHFYLDEASLL